MDYVYVDDDIAVGIKPAGVLSTDEPGGFPGMVRDDLGGSIRTVHRLDRAVSGLMVLARNARAASELSAQIRQGSFQKQYLAAVHGSPGSECGTFEDLLRRDKARKMTFIAEGPGKDVQSAALKYRLIAEHGSLSCVQIRLITGRTHQIRVQFAGRGMPLAGERKYSTLDDPYPLALWSYCVEFTQPVTGERVRLDRLPPEELPWSYFELPLREELLNEPL